MKLNQEKRIYFDIQIGKLIIVLNQVLILKQKKQKQKQIKVNKDVLIQQDL